RRFCGHLGYRRPARRTLAPFSEAARAWCGVLQMLGSFMAGPPGTGGGLGPPYFEGMAVLKDPLQGLALFQFQGGGQSGRTNQVELAVLARAPNDLQFRKVTHAAVI